MFSGCWNSHIPKPQRDDMLRDQEENGWETVRDEIKVVEEAPDCFNELSEDWGPTPVVEELYTNSKALFFYFMPKQMWRKIAVETTRYERQTRSQRVSQHEQNYTEEQHAMYLKKVDNFLEVTACEVQICIVMNFVEFVFGHDSSA
jgi:hypothetical protein